MKALVIDIRRSSAAALAAVDFVYCYYSHLPGIYQHPAGRRSLWRLPVTQRQRRRTLEVGVLGKLLLVFMLYMALGVFYSANPFNSSPPCPCG